MTNSMWWYLTRAAALTAWFFLTLTMVWGSIVSSRWVTRGRSRRWLLDLHPYFGSLGLAALALHIVSVVADTQSHLHWINVAVPFTASWRPTAIALGVLALWLLVAIEVTSIARRRLSRRTWHGIHLTSYAMAWAMAVHAVMSGTDLKTPVVAWGALVLVAATTLVTLRRALGLGEKTADGPSDRKPAAASARASSPAPAPEPLPVRVPTRV